MGLLWPTRRIETAWWLLCGVAMLFNPIEHLRVDRASWIIIDVLAALCFWWLLHEIAKRGL